MLMLCSGEVDKDDQKGQQCRTVKRRLMMQLKTRKRGLEQLRKSTNYENHQQNAYDIIVKPKKKGKRTSKKVEASIEASTECRWKVGCCHSSYKAGSSRPRLQ
ncbi:hypothetical protein VNO77_15383 [Canavalia gladiata]|uniref:Uncharacterized protein n=1 Tax=Canavalia gladiata TaxID=3824 RepID=A0AAN9LZ01_CANGL